MNMGGDKRSKNDDKNDNVDKHLAAAFLDTFVDLYLAMDATCISYGYGNYGYLVAKISNTACLQRHETPQNKQLGMNWNKKQKDLFVSIEMIFS